MSIHHRVYSRSRLLLRQQKTSSPNRTPDPLWPHLRRIGVPVYVLRGYTAFGDPLPPVQHRYLHYRPDRPSTSGWLAHRFVRPSLLKLTHADKR